MIAVLAGENWGNGGSYDVTETQAATAEGGSPFNAMELAAAAVYVEKHRDFRVHFGDDISEGHRRDHSQTLCRLTAFLLASVT